MASVPNTKIAIQISPLTKKNKNPATPSRLNQTIIPLRCLCGTGHSNGLSFACSIGFIFTQLQCKIKSYLKEIQTIFGHISVVSKQITLVLGCRKYLRSNFEIVVNEEISKKKEKVLLSFLQQIPP